ncbi:hypothetical protein FHT44_004929 [Mycolicibacterium sp. BK634]|uniref:hypothetical protein n=1 Tax=Mycolicibacterium sp. BK634 TaxID=2587099 RepID=UPI0016179B4F|nr:hypothetical protein [Mycolicibacterium sp. BK634]MBB3752417.1 hypothetical protein [Mycolicibacterium sp. BK634]
MSTKTVCGRPVTGTVDYPYRRKKVEQGSIEEFVAVLDRLFEHPQVEAVRWSQFTPSFNDGDPCVFSLGEFYVKLTDGDEEGGENEDGFYGEYDINEHFSTEDASYDSDNNHPIAEILDKELGWQTAERFDDVLESAFGDPAEITATREGFHVEFYEGGY